MTTSIRKAWHPPGNPTRAHGQRVLDAQITAIGRARGYFIPGNHDWERWGPDGWFFLQTQEGYLETHAPLLVAAGHDHSLQVHRDATGRFHVVSGAGSASKVDRVGKLDTSLMSVAAPGYMRLDSNTDGALRLTVTAIDGKNTPHAVFETCITPDS